MGFISRPFVCNHSHRNMEDYIVFGSTRQKLIVYPANNYPSDYSEILDEIIIDLKITDNVTPHIVSYLEPTDDGLYMPIAITCGVVGCGMDFIDPENLDKGIRFNRVDKHLLPIKEFEALVTFTDTGFELTKKRF